MRRSRAVLLLVIGTCVLGCANEVDWRVDATSCEQPLATEGERDLWAITEGPCTPTPSAPVALGVRGDGREIPRLGRGVWCFWSLRVRDAGALGTAAGSDPAGAPCRLVAISSDERVLPDESGEIVSRPRCVSAADRAAWDRAVEVLASCAPRRDPERCECPLSPSPSAADPLACGAPVQADWVSIGLAHACAAERGGEGLWCWGDAGGFGGTLGEETGPRWVEPAIDEAEDVTWLGLIEQVESGEGQVCVRNGRDQVVCAGEKAMASARPLRRASGALLLARDLSVGDELACAITRNPGGVTCWGRSPTGAPDAIWDERLPAGTSPESISVGDRHACVIALGTLLCWGCDSEGQITGRDAPVGSPCTTWLAPREVPPPDGASSWVEVDAGPGRTCAIDDRDRVACWGRGTDFVLAQAGAEAQDVSVGGGLTVCGQAVSDGRFRCAIDPRRGSDFVPVLEPHPAITIPYAAVRAGDGFVCGLRTRAGAGAVLCQPLDGRAPSDPSLGRVATAARSEAVCPVTRRD